MTYRNLVPLTLAVGLAMMGCAQTQALPVETARLADSVAPAFSDVPEAVDAPAGAASTALESQIEKVTVYSDLALVTRRAVADVTDRSTVFAFKRLPGWVDESSVRVSVDAGRIVDVRVERDFLARATDETYLAAERKHQELTYQLAGLDDELKILDAQKAQIESIKAFSLEKVTKDTTVGNISVKRYGDVVDFISDSLRATATARRTVELERVRLAPEHQASQRALNDLQNLLKLEETNVFVTMVSSAKTQSKIDLTYMMPGATWEPLHELRASTADPDKVEVTSYAVVTQTSGEDWGGAALSFSTQSSTEAVRIPDLDALTLGDTPTTSRVHQSKVSSFTRAENAYKGQAHLWNKANNFSKSNVNKIEQVFQSNFELLEVTQSRSIKLFQSLQKRGTTAHFQAKSAKSVRGDGHPVRLRIGRSALASAQKIVAVPEQSFNAARTLQMTNSSDQPFLPGKVAIYQNGAFLGMTEIDFIAEGEKFSLFLSVADHIKLSRKLDKKHSSLVRKKRTRMRVTYIVSAENLSDAPTSFTLADRIPVSENKNIKVTNVKIAPAIKPNTDGIVNWALTLAPKESRKFTISYQVEYPPTLILQTRRELNSAPRSPSRRHRKSKRRIEEQLLDFESAFH